MAAKQADLICLPAAGWLGGEPASMTVDLFGALGSSEKLFHMISPLVDHDKIYL